jgi:hypothetical protein
MSKRRRRGSGSRPERTGRFTRGEFALDATTRGDFYQERGLVSDTLAGIRFPKDDTASTLDHGGATPDFISDNVRREFERRHGLTP